VPGCCHSPNSGEWRGGASQGMSARTRLGPWEGATVVEWPRDRVQGSLGNGGNNCGRQHDKHGRGRVSTAFIERGGGRRGSFTSPRRHSARGGLARPMRWEAGLRSDRGGGHSARGAWLRGMPGGCDGGGGQGRGAMKSLLGHYGSRARTLRAGWPTRGYVHERARGIARRLALQSAGWGKTVR
jgi:hypothetical protein